MLWSEGQDDLETRLLFFVCTEEFQSQLSYLMEAEQKQQEDLWATYAWLGCCSLDFAVYQRQYPHTKQRTSILCRWSCRVITSVRCVVLTRLGHSCRGEALVRASGRVLQEERPARAQRRYKSGHTNELGRYRCLSSHETRRDVMIVDGDDADEVQSGSLHVFCVLPLVPLLLSLLDALRLYGETSVLSNEEAIVVFQSALDLFPVRHHRPFLLLGCPNARTDRHVFVSSRNTRTTAHTGRTVRRGERKPCPHFSRGRQAEVGPRAYRGKGTLHNQNRRTAHTAPTNSRDECRRPLSGLTRPSPTLRRPSGRQPSRSSLRTWLVPSNAHPLMRRRGPFTLNDIWWTELSRHGTGRQIRLK